jgi:hypothetical protein
VAIFIRRTCEIECGGDGSSLDTFYWPEGWQERRREGMRLTAMVDLQCISFRVTGEPRAETAEERGGDGVCISKEEERGHVLVEGR